jgi:syntaxin-binding protein 1
MAKNVFHLENLELVRKDFPNTPAVYFISPTRSSVERVIKDFKDAKMPHYASIHLFFSSKLQTNLMELLSAEKAIVERVKSFIELNVDLSLYEDNIYHLDQENSLNLFVSNLKETTVAAYLSQIGTQIFTV